MNATSTHAAANSPLTIGVRDSGVGGLTVAKCIREVLPHANLLYFADTAHVPYGGRAAHEVRHFALSISQFLIEHGAQIVVFACNTSSAIALDEARAMFPIPIVGMIEPGARAAVQASRSGRIGVLATQATVESGVYSQWIHHLRPDAVTTEIACPRFVPLVESERTCSQAARQSSREYLAPLLEANVDTIVLGCTHYPLLLPVLQEAAPHVRFVDPAEFVAREVAALAAAHEYSWDTQTAPRDIFFASGEEDGLHHWISQVLPSQSAIDIRRGPVFDLPSPKK